MVSGLLFLRHSGSLVGKSIGLAYNGVSIKTEKSRRITLKMLTVLVYY